MFARPPASKTWLPSRRRAGRGLVDVIVVAALLGFVAVLVLMALPRGRESARMAGCQRNLMQVGVGLQLYHQAARHYPTVADPFGTRVDGPIKAMLDALVIPDLLELNDPSKPPRPTASPPRGSRVPGLACPSDPNAMTRPKGPVVSYRANTGDDPAGRGGPFEPGRVATSAQVEAADGLAFTAAFAERLVGDGQDGHPGGCNYAISPAELAKDGEPIVSADVRGDAGSDWAEATWRSTLYNHALRPNADGSMISRSGRTALMGASSSHVHRVNVLMLDGSVRPITVTIDPRIWAGMGTVAAPEPMPSR